MDKLTMISTGEGPVGASKITGEVMDIMVRVPDMVNKMTGVDISKVTARVTTVLE